MTLFTAYAYPALGAPTSRTTPARQADVFNAQDWGWAPDGTDHSTEALALLAAVYAAGGGTIVFPPSTGVYRADLQLLIPNNGVTGARPYQKNLRLTGGGGGGINFFSGVDIIAPSIGLPNATVLDLRYQGTGGKILTLGASGLMIDNLTLKDGGSSNTTPFIYTTNTSLTIRGNNFEGSGNVGQDAIILGGTGTSVNATINSPFQGYGTVIDANMFYGLNRAVYGRTFCNSVRVTNNIFEGNVGTIAMEFDGTNSGGAGNFGIYVAANLVEMDTYVYGIKLSHVLNSTFIANDFWDPQSPHIADFLLDDNSLDNLFIIGYTGSTSTIFGGSSLAMQYSRVISSTYGNQFMPGRTTKASFNIQPGTAPTSPNDGDVWYDGSALKFRLGATTKTITLS